jgi:hypothetical protein
MLVMGKDEAPVVAGAFVSVSSLMDWVELVRQV